MFDDADKFLKVAVGLGVLVACTGVGYHFGARDQKSDRISQNNTNSIVAGVKPKSDSIFFRCSVKKEDFIYENAEPVSEDFQIRRGKQGWELGIWRSWGYDFDSSYVNIDPYTHWTRAGNVKVDEASIVIEASKQTQVTYSRQVISRYDGSWSWYYDAGGAVRAYPTTGKCEPSEDRSATRKF